MMRRLLLPSMLGLGGSIACTSTEPPHVADAVADVDTKAEVSEHDMILGLMYWAPEEYVLGSSTGLVFGAVVEQIEVEPARHPELRGAVIFEATLRVEHVFRQIDPPDARRPVHPLRPGDLVSTDGADGLIGGDRVLVFATTYDGGYGIVPKRQTQTPIGIVVNSWSDPIVGAVRRWLADETQWAADEPLWRQYGAAAIDCMRDEIPMSHCGSGG